MIKAMLVASIIGALYPETMVVTNLNTENDIVTMETSTGFIYEMDGVDDYMVGDLVSLIMDDNGTADIRDDRIVSAQYAGVFK